MVPFLTYADIGRQLVWDASKEDDMLKKFLNAWIVGTVSALVIGISAFLVAGLVAAIAELDSFVIGLGPIDLIEYVRDGSGFSTRTGVAFFPLSCWPAAERPRIAAYFRSRSNSGGVRPASDIPVRLRRVTPASGRLRRAWSFRGGRPFRRPLSCRSSGGGG